MSEKVILGEKYKDTISGFVGIAVCRSTWLHGSITVNLQGYVSEDGKVPDTEVFNEARLVSIKDTGIGYLKREPKDPLDGSG